MDDIKMVKRRKINAVLLLILLIIMVAGCATCFFGGASKEKATKVEDKILEACIMSHEFVKEHLKAPATADFENCNEKNVTYLGDSTFFVRGYVDAQNTFGARLRNNFYCKLKYNGNDNWTLVGVTLSE